MIYSLKGMVIALEQALLVIDVQGVGYGVQVVHPEIYSLQQPVTLLTFVHWNQENGPQLFGFSSAFERQTFMILVGCSGIGPKMALGILSQISPADLVSSVLVGDVKTLSSLKGVGPKKAESLILQLQDKVKKLESHQEAAAPGEQSALLLNLKNVSEVLASLSYSRTEVSQALDHLKSQATAASSFDELVRKALGFLAKSQ